jgi:hypothetical protein
MKTKMNRQQFLKTLFLGGAGILAAPFIVKEKTPPDGNWVNLDDILGRMPRGIQNHRHCGIDVDQPATHLKYRRFIGYDGLPEKDFVEIR